MISTVPTSVGLNEQCIQYGLRNVTGLPKIFYVIINFNAN